MREGKMPAKTKKSTSRVSKASLSKKKGFQFRWWMAVLLVAVVAVVGVVILRYSRASGGPAPKGPMYWLGDSLSTGLISAGGLQQKLQSAGYDPAFVNQDPGRSITKGGFAQQSALQAVDANNTNVCPSPQSQANPAIVAYCKANGNNYNPVKDAKTVVLFLGTNPETANQGCPPNGQHCNIVADASIFANAQKQLIDKIRTINPNAQIEWVDVAAPGSKALSNQAEFYYHNGEFPTKEAYDQWFENNYAAGRQRLQNTLNSIYNNSAPLNYNVASQFQFLWGTPPSTTGIIQTTDQKDPGGLLDADGVHYTAPGYVKLADSLVSSLQAGSYTLAILNSNPKFQALQPAATKDPTIVCQGLAVDPATAKWGQAIAMSGLAKAFNVNSPEGADFSYYIRKKNADGSFDDTTVDAKGRHEIQAFGIQPNSEGVYANTRPPQNDPNGTFIMPVNLSKQNITYQIFLRVFWRGHNTVSDGFSVSGCTKEVTVPGGFKGYPPK